MCNGKYKCYRIYENYICKDEYVNYSMITLLVMIFLYPIILLIKKIKFSCKKEYNENIDEISNVSIDKEETIQEETSEEESPPSYAKVFE